MCDKVDSFCYICALYTAKSHAIQISSSDKVKFRECFGRTMVLSEFVPKVICSSCQRNLYREKFSFSFKNPATWKHEQHIDTDCYFCSTNIARKRHSDRFSLNYPTTSLSLVSPNDEEMEAVEDMDEDLVVHEGDENMDCDDMEKEQDTETDTETDSDYEEDTDDSDYEPEMQDTEEEETSEPKLSDKQLRDMTKMLALSKEKDEMMVAFLKKAGVCEKEVKSYKARKRSHEYRQYFTTEEDFTYCKDIETMFETQFKMRHKPEEWRLFIDGSVTSLKVRTPFFFIFRYHLSFFSSVFFKDL